MKKIINAKIPLQEKAELIFGKNSFFAEPFIRLYLGDGIEFAVQMLGAQRAYSRFKAKFSQETDNKKASLLLMNFHSKIVYQFALKFKQ